MSNEKNLMQRIKEIRRFVDGDSTEKIVQQLASVAFERYGNDGGMGGELVVNLDDAIEIVKAGGKRDK